MKIAREDPSSNRIRRQGCELALRAKVFGMRVMAIDVTEIPPSVQERHGLAFCGKAGELPRLLAESDYLSVHAPLTTATRHMLGGAAFSTMKETT